MAANVKALREQHRLSYRDLEAKLREHGQPILASGLFKIERAERRVDVDELAALAWVLGPMPPGRLLSSHPSPLLSGVDVKRHEEAIGRATKAIAEVATASGRHPGSVLDLLDMAVFNVVKMPIRWADDDGR